jgi:hypothetical protein
MSLTEIAQAGGLFSLAPLVIVFPVLGLLINAISWQISRVTLIMWRSR